MTRKKLLIALGISVMSVAITIITYILLTKEGDRVGVIRDNSPTPTVDTSNTLQPGTYLLLPQGYVLSDKERLSIKNSVITTILVENGEATTIDDIRASFPNLIVHAVSDVYEYTFCGEEAMAVKVTTATGDQHNAHGRLFNSICFRGTKVSSLSRPSCNTNSISCLSESLIALLSSTVDTYFYSPSFPLLGIIKPAGLSIDFPYSTPIITWPSYTSAVLVQTGYSLEVNDSSGRRVHATGRLNSDNVGDFFVPTLPLSSQSMSATVRSWLTYGSVAATEPISITRTFAYSEVNPPINTPTSNSVKQIAWIPDWGMSAGIASIRKNPKKWATISPVWFTPNKNGTLNREPTTNSATLVKLLKDNNIKLIPTISLFDADILSEILNKNLDKHVTEIVSIVEKNGYAGIDLDYESTYEADQPRLIEFITKLAEQLHKKNKALSFTVLPKIDDRRIYSFLPQTHQAQDWQAIGAIVDEFRIMAYDFTGQGSLQPGPLSPYQWNETLIKYALSKMPAEKIVLALPLYSHGWPKPKSSNLAGANNDLSLSSGKQKNTISLQHTDIDYIKGHSSFYREAYDTWNKEVRAEFKYNGVERVMYYLNKKSIDERIDLAERYGIKGICYWRIGNDSL